VGIELERYCNLCMYDFFLCAYRTLSAKELDGGALIVRSWKLSNVSKGRMGDQNILSQAALFFGRHVKSLVPAGWSKF
jgi:hypothetical protein